MKKLAFPSAIILVFAALLIACRPTAATTGPYVDANGNSTHESGEGVACSSLPVWSGGTFFTTPGQTISGYQFTSNVAIGAANVTFQDNCVTGNSSDGLVKLAPGTTNATIWSNRITSANRCAVTDNDPPASCKADMGIYAYPDSSVSALIAGNDISGVVQGVNMAADNLTIVDNYIHDLRLTRSGSSGDHLDGIISNGNSSNLDIEQNDISVNPGATQTSAIALFEDGYRCGRGNVGPQCPDNNIKVIGNYIHNGGYCMYPPLISTNVRIEDNHFGPQCTAGATHTQALRDPLGPGAGNTFTGNVWDDDSTPVS